MEIKISLSFTPLEFACIRMALNGSAAGIYNEFRDKDSKLMNQYQHTILYLADKFNNGIV